MTAASIPWDRLAASVPMLRASLRRRCRDEHELDDHVQTALVRAARWLPGSNVTNLGAYLRRCAFNARRDELRVLERTRFVRPDAPEPVAKPAPDAEGGDLDRAREALSRLPEDERAFLLTYWQLGRDLTATAEATGLSETVVKTRAHRALARAREMYAVLTRAREGRTSRPARNLPRTRNPERT